MKWKYADITDTLDVIVSQNNLYYKKIGNIFDKDMNFTELMGHDDLLEEIRECLLSSFNRSSDEGDSSI